MTLQAKKSIQLVLLIVLGGATDCLASGPWILPYDKLFTKVGFNYLRSSENFNTYGAVEDVHVGNQLGIITKDTFWVEAEYGIAPSWSAMLHFSFVNDSFSAPLTGVSLLTGSGLPQMESEVKWNLLSGNMPITFELSTQIPFTGETPANSTALLVGDGNFEFGLALHFGYQTGPLRLSIAPGTLFRFSGYSTAFTGNANVLLLFRHVYFGTYANFIVSFTQTPFEDSSLSVHDAPGTGGSYLFLSGSPIGATLGGKIGVTFPHQIVFEAHANQSVAGQRFPDYFEVGAAVGVLFDFFVPDKRVPIHEVPFNSEGTSPAD